MLDIPRYRGCSEKEIKMKNIAVKNSKGQSDVFKKSAFFTTGSRVLISQATGITYRRNHSGKNYWSIFNIEGNFPNKKDEGHGSWANFGTRDGNENCIPWLYENEITPISLAEWEALSGRKFSIEEFSWFNGVKELIGIHLVKGGQLITEMSCYEGMENTIVVRNKECFMWNGLFHCFSGYGIDVKWSFGLRSEAEEQAKLVNGVAFKHSEYGYVVMRGVGIGEKKAFAVLEKKGGSLAYNDLAIAIAMQDTCVPDGWYSFSKTGYHENAQKRLYYGTLGDKCIAWEGRWDSIWHGTIYLKVEDSCIVKYANSL